MHQTASKCLTFSNAKALHGMSSECPLARHGMEPNLDDSSSDEVLKLAIPKCMENNGQWVIDEYHRVPPKPALCKAPKSLIPPFEVPFCGWRSFAVLSTMFGGSTGHRWGAWTRVFPLRPKMEVSLPPGMRPKDAIGNLKALGDLARPYLWRLRRAAGGFGWIPKVSKKQLHLQTDLDRMHVKCPTDKA